MKEIKIKLYSKELKKNKIVRVYLPLNYEKDKDKSYKVLYMQDGQNIDHESPFSSSSWGVIDTLKENNISIIVVGVDNDKDRNREYVPFSLYRDGKRKSSLSNKYNDFFINTLMPYIENNFRVKKGKENTFILGSSYGSVISSYIVMKNKGTFGLCGLFSHATFEFMCDWINLENKLKVDNSCFYDIKVGDNEANERPYWKKYYLASFNDEINNFKANNVKYRSKIYKNHYHSEVCWKEQFKDFIKDNKKFFID